MTKEELEKEAEEYYYKTYPVTLNIGEESRKEKVTKIFLDGHKAGAEFAYNKANEWHKEIVLPELLKRKRCIKKIF